MNYKSKYNLTYWNIRGILTNNKKKQDIANILKNLNSDIIFLAETNIDTNILNPISIPIPIQTFEHFSVGNGRGTGLSLLYRNSATTYCISKEEIGNTGRAIFSKFRIHNEVVSILAIYAPAKSKERKNFFLSLKEFLHTPDFIIGDFNIDVNKLTKKHPWFKILINSYHLNLLKLENQNYTFTDSNNRKHYLDCVYTNKFASSIASKCTAIENHISDHCIIKLSLNIKQSNNHSYRRKPWRANKLILNNDKIVETISDFCKNMANTSLNPIKKWNHLKNGLKKIAKKSEGILEENMLINKLHSLLRRTNKNINDNNSKDDLKPILDKLYYNKISKKSLEYKLFNELPSSYLTQKLKRDNSAFKLNNILLEDDSISDDPTLILNKSHEFFSKSFKKEEFYDFEKHDTLLTRWKHDITLKNWEGFLDPFTSEEVKEVLYNMKSDKAPGPDGLPPFIYKTFWNQLGIPLLTFLNNMLKVNQLPTCFTEGLTVTLYKGKGLSGDMNNRRPITLLNTDYKIFSSLINRRLEPIIQSVCSSSQNGFLKGRSIFSNITLLDTILSSGKKDPQFSCIILDFKKAFDSIYHMAIRRTLFHIKAPNNVTNSIMNLLNNSYTRIIVNNLATKRIKIGKGTRQGDPISPSLFILTLECFNNYINSSNEISGFTLGNDTIKSLLFADDTTIITRDMYPNKIMHALNLLRNAIGIEVNWNKSQYITNNTKFIVPNCNRLKKEENFRYLGYIFNTNGIINNLDTTMTKIHSLANKWKSLCYTPFSIATVINHYLATMAYYQFYCSPILPITKYNKYEGPLKDMLFNNDKCRIKRINLSRAQAPFHQGGLNIPSMMNKHLAFKVSLFISIIYKDNCSRIETYWKTLLDTTQNLSSIGNIITRDKVLNKFLIALKKFNTLTNNALDIIHPLDINPKSLYTLLKTSAPLTKFSENQLKWFIPNSPEAAAVWRDCRHIKDHLLKSYLWKFLNRAFPIYPGSQCPHCSATDNHQHTFIDCPITKRTLEVLKAPLTWTPPFSFHDASQRSYNLTAIAIICRIIWTDRCNKKYNRPSTHPTTALLKEFRRLGILPTPQP